MRRCHFDGYPSPEYLFNRIFGDGMKMRLWQCGQAAKAKKVFNIQYAGAATQTVVRKSKLQQSIFDSSEVGHRYLAVRKYADRSLCFFLIITGFNKNTYLD